MPLSEDTLPSYRTAKVKAKLFWVRARSKRDRNAGLLPTSDGKLILSGAGGGIRDTSILATGSHCVYSRPYGGPSRRFSPTIEPAGYTMSNMRDGKTAPSTSITAA